MVVCDGTLSDESFCHMGSFVMGCFVMEHYVMGRFACEYIFLERQMAYYFKRIRGWRGLTESQGSRAVALNLIMNLKNMRSHNDNAGGEAPPGRHGHGLQGPHW